MFLLINSRLEIAYCSTVPNDKKKISILPFPYKQKLITCLATTVSCECNWSLRRLQVKIENILIFFFSCCPKNLNCPKFGGAAAPLAPLARTPMDTAYSGLWPETYSRKELFPFCWEPSLKDEKLRQYRGDHSKPVGG